MNSVFELVVVGAIVASAVVFIAVRIVGAVRGRQASCCSDSDVDPAAPWMSPCDGCSGCAGHEKKSGASA
jgi:hypothetical protein